MAAQLVSLSGDLLAIYAIFSVVSFRLRAGPSQVTSIMIAWLLPQVLLGPLAGFFADRWNTKATMIVSDLTRAALAATLVLPLSIGAIHGVVVLLSAISTFFLPAQTILLRAIVPASGLMAANALMMQILQLTQIVVPGLAGLLTARTGAAVCFWLDAASFLFSAVMIAAIPPAGGLKPGGTGISSILTGLAFGARTICTDRTLAFTVVALSGGSFAAICYSALIPTYVRDVLHASADLFGVLGTLLGFGTVLGTYALARLEKRASKESLVAMGLLGAAAGIFLLAVSAGKSIAVVAALVTGAGVALIITPAQTLLQTHTPVAILGRISGGVRSSLALMQIAGLFLSGAAAAAVGIRASLFAVAAAVALLAALQRYSFSRSTRL